MNYLLPSDLLSFMFNMCNFREIYGVTYADYICNTVDVSSILEDLIYSSDYLNNESENVCLSVTN